MKEDECVGYCAGCGSCGEWGCCLYACDICIDMYVEAIEMGYIEVISYENGRYSLEEIDYGE